ncbi:YbhB/YbcL family Raf kinase inhibitor-like protein [Mucilaginibacter sp. CAU 1740]|uniref:YbhB/YbcL family Raf kinase inhibitor-like protein n=1 Tax=Mucilaginibacter sp. CAU 1740 TaxID=3140365 RepID=UPI00325B067A
MKETALLLLLAVGSLAAKAQIPQPDPDTTAQHFLIVASIGNLQEVSASQLAVQKAKRSEVRMFGEMMVKEHDESEQQLVALTKRRGIMLPTAATGGIQPDIALKNAGGNFDELYVHGMVSAHGAAVQSFAAYAINGKDPAVKAWAKQMLPKLKTHHDYISTLEKVINQHLGFINVSSSAFIEGGMIPAKYSCEGSQASPPLNFKGIPANAKSLAIIVHDPDAPKAGGVTHWVVWNIPVASQISENFKGGVQGQNSDQQPGYMGMCPPDGTHRYNFFVYALDSQLSLDKSADQAALEKAMKGHILAEGVLTGLYMKSK